MKVWVLVVLASTTAWADSSIVASGDGATKAGYLRFDFAERSSHDQKICEGVSVSWIGGEQVLWTQALPQRMRWNEDSCDSFWFDQYRKKPDPNGIHQHHRVLTSGDMVLVGSDSGVIALSKRRGDVNFDYHAPVSRPVWGADRGQFRLGECNGDVGGH